MWIRDEALRLEIAPDLVVTCKQSALDARRGELYLVATAVQRLCNVKILACVSYQITQKSVTTAGLIIRSPCSGVLTRTSNQGLHTATEGHI